MNLVDIGIGLFLALWLVFTLMRHARVVRDDERMVVNRLGHFHAMLEPGFHISMPGTADQFTRITLGDLGTYQGDGLSRVGEAVFPSESGALSPQDPIQITSFRDGRVWVSKAAVRVVACEKCGHENRVSA